jgi:hypothetical protein
LTTYFHILTALVASRVMEGQALNHCSKEPATQWLDEDVDMRRVRSWSVAWWLETVEQGLFIILPLGFDIIFFSIDDYL